jgi:hypothetical protein
MYILQRHKKLNALGIIATESKMQDKISYKKIIEDLILKNTKRIIFSK